MGSGRICAWRRGSQSAHCGLRVAVLPLPPLLPSFLPSLAKMVLLLAAASLTHGQSDQFPWESSSPYGSGTTGDDWSSTPKLSPDGEALIEFRNSFLSQSCPMQSWFPPFYSSDPPCSFGGVTCGDGPAGEKVVIGLDLGSCFIEAPLGTALFRLKFLTSLKLGQNRFYGSIGNGIKAWTGLTELELSENNLSGKLPPELRYLAALRRLDLRENHFTGPVPARIFGLPRLALLDLSGNSFSGSLPDTTLQRGAPVSPYSHQLVELVLQENSFSGRLPGALGSIPSLRVLTVRNNKLGGSIPGSFGQLKEVFYLDLSRNNFSGNVPPQFGQMEKLEHLYLSRNNLTYIGPPAPNFFNGLADTLSSLDLSDNRLYANLHLFSRLTSLNSLNLARNKFVGKLPAPLGRFGAEAFEGMPGLCGNPLPPC